jgi:hypothetical protein
VRQMTYPEALKAARDGSHAHSGEAQNVLRQLGIGVD